MDVTIYYDKSGPTALLKPFSVSLFSCCFVRSQRSNVKYDDDNYDGVLF